MKEKILEIMESVFETNGLDLKGNVHQNDLENWDSLRHLNLIIELEEAFDVSYEPEEIGDMTSLDKIIAITKEKKEENA